MACVLVTGATGFIGGHLVSALVGRGDQVRCLVRSPARTERLRPLNVELVTGHVLDREALRAAIADVDVVYNLAGLTCALRSAELFATNGDGPGLVAEVCAERPHPPVHVLVSSVAAAGPTAPGRLRVEQDPEAPVSHYGRSKLAGERAARRWARQVPTTIVRPGIVFGQYDRAMMPVMQTIYRLRAHVNAGLFSPLLSLIYAEDLVELLLRAADKGERAEPFEAGQSAGPVGKGVYFGAAPEWVRYSDLGRLLAPALLGQNRPVVIYLPSLLAWMVAGGNELVSQLRRRPDILNLDKIREASVASWACSPAKAEQQLGFYPAAPLAARLERTARWYRESGWL